MNLDELRTVQTKERQKDSLQHLRDDFYDEVAAYIADLRAARDRRAEQVSNPFSDDDVRRMSDEIETSEEVIEALYERRVGKVVKLASFAAADMPVDSDGMTSQERALFDDLVDRIETNKSTVLDVLLGDSDSATIDSVADPAADDGTTPGAAAGTNVTDSDMQAESDAGDTLAEAMGASTSESSPESASEPDRRTEVDPAAGPPGSPEQDGPARPPETEPEQGTDGISNPAAGDAAGIDGGGTEGIDGGNGARVDDDRSAPELRGESTTDGGTVVRDADSSNDAPATDTTAVDAETDSTPADQERTTVRITRDVGEIFGVDEREYDLSSEDVVSLPAENADPLVARDAAEPIE